MNKAVGYYNGKTDLLEKMMIPAEDRAVYFGDGVYDAAYAVHGKLFKPEYHLERFYNSMRLLSIPFQMSPSELLPEIQRCAALAGTDGTVFVYWQVSRGTGLRDHVFPSGCEPNLFMYAVAEDLTDLRKPVKVITEKDTRFFHCNIKTLNLIPNVMAAEHAHKKGCQEAIFHRGQRVTECAHSNVNILKDGAFITPPLDNLILPGTCRRHFIDICRRMKVPVQERPFTLDELFNADEIMLTSCQTFGARVLEIDGKSAGGKDGELLGMLQHEAENDFYAETGFRPDII